MKSMLGATRSGGRPAAPVERKPAGAGGLAGAEAHRCGALAARRGGPGREAVPPRVAARPASLPAQPAITAQPTLATQPGNFPFSMLGFQGVVSFNTARPRLAWLDGLGGCVAQMSPVGEAGFDPAEIYAAARQSARAPALEGNLPALRPVLRPYQRRAAAWMVARERGELARSFAEL